MILYKPSYALDFSKGIATNPTMASHSAKGAELDASRNSFFSTEREDGQFLILPSIFMEEVGALSDLPLSCLRNSHPP